MSLVQRILLVSVFSASLVMASSAIASECEPSFDERVRDAQPPAGPIHRPRDGVYSPIEAVLFAAQAAPRGVEGTQPHVLLSNSART